jgi:hypothetical protein
MASVVVANNVRARGTINTSLVSGGGGKPFQERQLKTVIQQSDIAIVSGATILNTTADHSYYMRYRTGNQSVVDFYMDLFVDKNASVSNIGFEFDVAMDAVVSDAPVAPYGQSDLSAIRGDPFVTMTGHATVQPDGKLRIKIITDETSDGAWSNTVRIFGSVWYSATW